MLKRKFAFFALGSLCLCLLSSCGADGRVNSSQGTSSLTSGGNFSSTVSDTSMGSGIVSDAESLMSSVDEWFSDMASDVESRLESGHVGDTSSQ